MKRRSAAAFALLEVLIGLAIFSIGILALGRSVQNCMNATALSAQDDRVRLLLANRMAEVQATPGFPDAKKEIKIDTSYGQVRLLQTAAPANLKDEKDLELAGINHVTLVAEWRQRGVTQSRKLEFYVYRAG